jgi:hypothetical protein
MIPREIAGQIPARAEAIAAEEAKLIALCQTPDFSLDKLRAALAGEQKVSP